MNITDTSDPRIASAQRNLFPQSRATNNYLSRKDSRILAGSNEPESLIKF